MEPRTLVALAALLLGPLLSGCLALSIPVVPTPTPIPTATRALPPTRTPRPTATPSPTVTPTPTASPTPTLTPTPTNTPGPSPTPTATHTPTPTPVCDCSANNYDCKDFATHAGAQACFAYCWQEVGMDVHHFDRDEDGLACETLP